MISFAYFVGQSLGFLNVNSRRSWEVYVVYS